MLTEQEIAHFETFGFLVLRQLFSPEEMAAMMEETDALLAANEGIRNGPSHHSVAPFVELSERLRGLPEEDRIFTSVEQLLGEGFVWGNSEGVSGSFNESNDHQWHSDRAGQIDLQYTRLKIMIYLQSMRKDAGALRVIPGSHHQLFHRELLRLQPQQLGTAREAFGVDGAELCCHPVEVDPGDVVMFNHYLYHGVYGKQSLRKYIALKFAARPETEIEYDALKPHKQDASSLHDSYRNSERPRIRSMVAGLLEWEDRLGEKLVNA